MPSLDESAGGEIVIGSLERVGFQKERDALSAEWNLSRQSGVARNPQSRCIVVDVFWFRWR